jgi:hypothetical protein
LPWLSFVSASSGGAGRRPALPPLRRPWRAAARARSGPSSRNKPIRLGLRPRSRGSELPSRARRGGGNGGIPLDPHSGSLDLEPPVAGGFGCRWRMLRQGLFSLSTDLDGRGWRRHPLPLSIGAAGLLLLTLLSAGRGGEGLGVRSGVVVAGGYSRSFPSNGRRVVEMSGEVAPAWCRGLLGSDIETQSPNKLEAGWILDLGLESPVTPSSSPPRVLLYVASALPACRGGEGKSGDNMPRHWWSPWMRDVEESLLLELALHRQECRCFLLIWSGRGSLPTRAGCLSTLLRVGFFSMPPSYACLLPSVAGSGSLTAGRSFSAALAKTLLLLSPSVGLGAGRPPFRAHVRRRGHAV